MIRDYEKRFMSQPHLSGLHRLWKGGLKHLFFCLSLFFLYLSLFSCASTFKASIDTSARGKILWPGPPENPKIRYLWSLSLLGEERSLADVFFGEEDVFDPVNARSLRTPTGIYKDNDRLYVVDPGAFRVSVINLKTLETFHLYRLNNRERLLYPVSVVSDGSGNIYVADSKRGRVYLFDQRGDYMKSLDIDFRRPVGLAFEQGYLFVSDSSRHCIYRINRMDGSVFIFGKNGTANGEFNYPTFITAKNGMLYVVDSMNNRIQVFDINGNFITTFGNIGNTYADIEKPKGIAVDSMGDIYVVDAIQDTVKIFDLSGNILLFFGEKGRGYGEFWLPSGIFIDKDDTIYVADTYNSRVQVFELIK